MKVSDAIADLHVRELKRMYRIANKKDEESLKRNPYKVPSSKQYKDKIYKYLLEQGFSQEECVEVFNKA